MELKKEIELFEEILLANPDFDKELLEKDEDGDYRDCEISDLLGIFQAGIEAAERKARQDAKGFILVPKADAQYFSHDFNGDGFKYHSTLDEARKEAEASLDWYRDQVADGKHVNDMGEFGELCYGVVLEQARYSVDHVITQKDVDSGESRHAVGTEILSLFLGAENA